MKIIHRYIASNFLKTLAVAVLFSTLLFVISDFLSTLSVLIKGSVSIKKVLEYYYFYTPFLIYFTFPFVFGLSVLISLGLLSARNEIIVMRASGLSIFKIAKPVIYSAAIAVVVMFLLKEGFINYGLERASFIKHYYLKNKDYNGFYMKIGNFFIKAKSLDADKKTFIDVVAYKVEGDFSGINEVIKAKRVIIKKGRAVFEDGNKMLLKTKKTQSFNKIAIPFKGSFYQLVSLSKFKEPSIFYLFSHLYSSKGNFDFYLSKILFRIFYPFSVVILTLIALVFVLKTTPRRGGLVKNIFVGSVIFIVYIGTFELINSMGKYSIINPFWSLAIFILFWLVVSLYNLFKLGV
ncbi:LptF/LptG family permease [Hippea jasoniae]|uniref:LptF/LptG family permease n=1 Tax=Hippea jasoniae TaxID=944479 RepID=UPI00054FEDF3|nr:LptF/LptG family permease [Hippea jasoniae]